MNKYNSEFVFVNSQMWSNEHDPLSCARIRFLRRDFEGMIEVLKDVLHTDPCSGQYRNACITNLAMAYHVRGYYEEAKELYGCCDNTVLGLINYYAFCHRYFEYKNIDFNVKRTKKLQEILNHNRLNYILNTRGARAALEYWDKNSVNIYDEQIINEIKTRIGKSIDICQAEKYEKAYRMECNIDQINSNKGLEGQSAPDLSNKIGIYVTDLQRHKDSALIYQIVEELIPDFEVIIYFSNIFQNKLIKSFKDVVAIRDISGLGYGEIINLINEDRVSILIDTAEYGIRNNHIAIANCGIKTVTISEMLKNSPIIINSNRYYQQNICTHKEDGILILGDLRYVLDEELKLLRDKYDNIDLTFESHALDEPLFMSGFIERLKLLDFKINKVTLRQGVLPFSAYMNFISSFRKIVLLHGTTKAEFSEVEKSKVPYEWIDGKKGTFTRNCIMDVKEVLKNAVENSVSDLKGRLRVLDDMVLCYKEGGKYYLINCTCNGDLLVFDDIVEDRNEYFVVI